MKKEGKYCSFDFSAKPDREKFAQNVVEYFDRKVQEVFNTLGVPLPGTKAQIKFSGTSGAMYITPNCFELNYNIQDNDLGAIIHECLHYTQQLPQTFYDKNVRVIEGVADYYRITLSDDKQGDYFNNDKRNLVEKFDTNELYNSGSEFIAYLRKKANDKDFIKQLADKINSKDQKQLDDFFKNKFGKGYDTLIIEYSKNRTQEIGKNPKDISRFDFFTNL